MYRFISLCGISSGVLEDDGGSARVLAEKLGNVVDLSADWEMETRCQPSKSQNEGYKRYYR